MVPATIFHDATVGGFIKFIQDAAEAVHSSVTFTPVSCPNEPSFIAAWHQSHGGAGAGTQSDWVNSASYSDRFVCFVSGQKTLRDADFAYAVMVAKIPSLTLTPCECLSPLLHCPASEAREDQLNSISSFFAVPSSKSTGKVIVIEGGDGAGKATQTSLLVKHLAALGQEVHTLDFPYEKGLYGDLVRVVLSGKKGSINQLDPRLFSFTYSLNRFGCTPELRFWLQRGATVVLDRYYTANFGHQASKLPEGERRGFIEELEFTEVEWLGVPRSGIVLYLDLPPAAALEAMKKDSTRKHLDIHETAGDDYKEKVRHTYLWCCDHLSGWSCVPCYDVRGGRLSKDAVHHAILQHLQCKEFCSEQSEPSPSWKATDSAPVVEAVSDP